MGTFQITTPDGKKFKVTAPDAQTAMDSLNEAVKPSAPGNTALADAFHRGIAPRDAGTMDAIVQGGRQGVTFGFADELRAGAQAAFSGESRSPVTGRKIEASQPGTFDEKYNANLTRERGALSAARENHPVAAAGGEIGGAVLSSAMLPVLAPVRGAGLGAEVANGALNGAAAGAAYGFGAGEGGVGNRLGSAAVGGATGGAAGAIIPAAVAGAKYAAGKVAAPFRAAMNPEAEASRRVGMALTRDGSSPQQAQAMLNSAGGQPLVVADAGGETTRALARSAGNTSPEARDAINAAVDARQNTQIDRAEAFIKGLVPRANATQTADDLKAAARRVNEPAYRSAYNQAPAMWTPELKQLTTSPDVQDAISKATRIGANKATASGYTPPVNPFVKLPDGSILPRVKPDGSRALPSLQFWDHVKQALDDKITVAQRAGENGQARDLTMLKTQLVDHLDSMVPAYKSARQGAAQFFGAQDALEAGQKFVAAKVENEAAKKVVAKMSAPERELFAEGFATDLIARIREGGNRYDVANSIFVKSPAARERVQIALGPQKAAQLEAFVRSENVMTMLKRAVQGNSTTARQLAELGLAGGASSVINGGFDPTNPNWIATALMVRGIRMAGARVDVNVARRVGEMLASHDPKVLNQAATRIGMSPTMMKVLRNVEMTITRATGPVAPTGAFHPVYAQDGQPEVPGPGNDQANGGGYQ